MSYILNNLDNMRRVCPNIAQYVNTSNMATIGISGTEVEILALATILSATLYVFSQCRQTQKWLPYRALYKFCILLLLLYRPLLSGDFPKSGEVIIMQNLNHHHDPALL